MPQLRHYTSESVRLSELSGDLVMENEARRYMLHRQFRLGDLTNALHHLERLTQIAHALQNPLAQIQARHFYAGYHFQVGNFDEMANIHAEIMPTLRQVGTPLMISVATMREVVHAQRRLDLGGAMAIVQGVMHFAHTYQIMYLEAIALTFRGNLYLGLGDLEAATEDLDRSIFLLRRQKDQTDLRSALLGRAIVHLAAGEPDAALALVEPLLPLVLAGDLGNVADRYNYLAGFCRVLLACEDSRARSMIERAYALLVQTAQTIPNQAHRRTFWQNVPENREMRWLYRHRRRLTAKPPNPVQAVVLA
jgi:tetratricopeptide (TPR) repeat protein